MKEMITRNNNQGDIRMKKTFLVLALALVLMLALGATPAFAKYAGYSSSKQYVPWAEAQGMASQNADAALMARGPHSGYATTTIKCAVCHSVHRAGGKLLNEGSACSYCHTSASHGGGAVASDLISWDVANQGPHSSRCTNDDCHGGPHGVGSSTYDGAASRLITAKADTNIASDLAANGLPASTMNTWSGAGRAIGTGGLCSRAGCHTNSMFGVVTAGAENTRTVGVDKSVTGHRVIAAATTNWNANGTDFPTTKTNLTIAFKPVEYCNSCHDLADDNNAGKRAFPHAINDVVSVAQGKPDTTKRVAVWLTAAADAETTSQVVGPYNQYSGVPTSTAPVDAAGSPILDGICLKCHVSGTVGVGKSY